MSFLSPFYGNVIQPTDVSFRAVTLSANTTLEWPINGTATNNYVARIMNVTASAGSLTLRMPPANQASVGEDSLVRNVGANTFTLADYDGNTITTIAAGEAKYVYITTNSTTAGTWGLIAFGVGTSNADAAVLQGYGLKAIGSTLNQAYNVNTFSSNYTAVDGDRASAYVWTGGSGTLTLPSAATVGEDWFFLVRNGGTGTLTISPTGGQLINATASLAMQPADSAVIISSGGGWYTVGLGRSTQFNFTQLTKAVTTGSYTLTASEAANVVQKYTGTLTNNVTVVLPETIQVYYITNQTDGGVSNYQITFTTGVSGAAVATVPAGQQVILLCDSVNLYNASTIAAGASNVSLVDGTVAAPALNFATETNTGIYRPGSGEFGISILGTKRFGLTATGLTINGTGTFGSGTTGGISGGLFT
jgi:hypothetical protein